MPKKKRSKKSPIQKISAKGGSAFGGKKLSTQVTKLLDDAKVKYKILEHKVVYTAHDVGATAKKKLSEIAKVVLVRADKDLMLIVLPAHKYLDFQGIRKALKIKKVSLASEKDIAKYLKTKVGLLHPFGQLFNLPPHPTLSPKGAKGIMVMLDKSLAKAKKMIASAGTYTHSVELTLKDYGKLVKPTEGSFAKKDR